MTEKSIRKLTELGVLIDFQDLSTYRLIDFQDLLCEDAGGRNSTIAWGVGEKWKNNSIMKFLPFDGFRLSFLFFTKVSIKFRLNHKNQRNLNPRKYVLNPKKSNFEAFSADKRP